MSNNFFQFSIANLFVLFSPAQHLSPIIIVIQEYFYMGLCASYCTLYLIFYVILRLTSCPSTVLLMTMPWKHWLSCCQPPFFWDAFCTPPIRVIVLSALGAPFSFSPLVYPGTQPLAQICPLLSHPSHHCSQPSWFCKIPGWCTVSYFL